MSNPRIKTKAPAKLNLSLHVVGKREDGYHELESIITFAEDIADGLEVKESAELKLHVTGPFAENLETGDNLVIRAAEILAQEFKVSRGAALTLTKNIPVAAGLGGGSADAAAAISLLCEFWDIKKDDEKKYNIGISLGADIPACQIGRPVLVKGIGEQLREIKNLPGFFAVLANPGIHVATSEIFSMGFSDYREKMGSLPEEQNRWQEFLGSTGNDLQDNAISEYPVIGEVLDALENTRGKIISRMSGSGATCFALFSEREGAEEAAKNLKKDHPDWWVVSSKLLSG